MSGSGSQPAGKREEGGGAGGEEEGGVGGEEEGGVGGEEEGGAGEGFCFTRGK